MWYPLRRQRLHVQATGRAQSQHRRKAELFGSVRHAVDPEFVFLMRPDDWNVARSRHFRNARRGQMAVRHQNFFNFDALFVDKFIQQSQIAARINHRPVHGFFIQKTVQFC